MNSYSWNWDDVRYFLAAARGGTLSSAARALRVGHVTVGRRICSLEASLGTRLFDRTPDGLILTAAGGAILDECARMEEAAGVVERISAGGDSRIDGTVRLATTEALAQAIVPLIAGLRNDHPGLQVDLDLGVRTVDISRREADLAVRFARPTAPALVCRKVAEVGFALYASRSYLDDRGVPRRGGGLAGHDLIAFRGMPAASAPFFMGESLEGSRFATRCNHALTQASAAAAGMGIAELACFLGDSRSDLVRVWPDEPPNVRAVWLILHEDLRRSARIRLVSASIADGLRRQRAVLRNGRLA